MERQLQQLMSVEVFSGLVVSLVALGGLLLSWGSFKRRKSREEGDLKIECAVAPVAGADGWCALDLRIYNLTADTWRIDRLEILKPRALEGIARHQLMVPTTSGHWVELSLKQKPGRKMVWLSGQEVRPHSSAATGEPHEERVYLRIPGNYEAVRVVVTLRVAPLAVGKKARAFKVVRMLPETTPDKSAGNLAAEPLPRDRPLHRPARKHELPVSQQEAR